MKDYIITTMTTAIAGAIVGAVFGNFAGIVVDILITSNGDTLSHLGTDWGGFGGAILGAIVGIASFAKPQEPEPQEPEPQEPEAKIKK